MNTELDKQKALCQSIATATRQEVGMDFVNLANMVNGLSVGLEAVRIELDAIRVLLEASVLKKEMKAARASAAKTKQGPPQIPPQESTPASTPANAMLFFVRQLVDDVEGARADTLEGLPDADAVRAIAETAPKNERGKLLALADKWTGKGSELFPADWRVLGRVAWKHLGQERQDTIRAAFKAARTNAASA